MATFWEEPQVEETEEQSEDPIIKKQNTLPIWGNKETMNINILILKNIKSSPYFKQDLFRLKTYHEVIDEIYYKVGHLEPWEKNSRKLASQIGHAGEVRGVSAGGIVSTPYCLLYKLFTLKLTRKQLRGMLDHSDSPYIRGLGFMYIRYCQPPKDFLEWFEPYFDDEEEIDLKAGGGFLTTIGEMCKMIIRKLDWFGTLFPRIPVTVETAIKAKLKPAEPRTSGITFGEAEKRLKEEQRLRKDKYHDDDRPSRDEGRSKDCNDQRNRDDDRRSRDDEQRSRDYDDRRSKDYDDRRSKDYDDRRSKDYDDRRSKDYDDRRSKDYDDRRSKDYDDRRSKDYDDRRSKDYDDRRSKDYDDRRSKDYDDKRSRNHYDRERDRDYNETKNRDKKRSPSPSSKGRRSRTPEERRGRSPSSKYKSSKGRSRSREREREQYYSSSKRNRSRSRSRERSRR